MKECSVYKIKDKTGRYSSGGMNPRFVKDGKCWGSIGQLKNHLRQFYGKKHHSESEEKYRSRNSIPGDWVIVEFTETKEVGLAKNLFGDEI